MKNLLCCMLIAITYLSTGAGCNNSSKIPASPGKESAKAGTWYAGKTWMKGLPFTPHESINRQEFYRQYHANNKWWDEAFEFIKTKDLENLAPGKYVIDSGNVIATVAELNPREKDSTNWEAHRDFNDLQYIIKGKVQMGVFPMAETAGRKVTMVYDPVGDNERFAVTGGQYYDAVPGTFFIFSPEEIHKPAFKVAGYNSVKKIVIKVRVPKN